MNDRELVDAYLHDRLTAAQRRALVARLPAEPELRGALRAGLEMEAFLVDLHQPATRQPLSVRRWCWFGGSAAAAAVLVAAALLWLFAEASTPTRVLAVSGSAMVMRATGEMSAAQTGMHLDAGDRLQTEMDGALRMQLRERVVCSVGNSAELTLSEQEHADLVVRNGRLDVMVEPPASFVLATPRGTVRVLGTRFSVDVQPDRDLIRVSRGRVHVASEADKAPDKAPDTHILDAGHHLVLTDGGCGVVRDTVGDDLQPWLHYDFDATHGRVVRASGDAGRASDLLARPGPPLEVSGGAVRIASERQLRTHETLPRLRELLEPASAWSVSLWVEQPAMTAQDRNLVLLVLATPDPAGEAHNIHLAISLGTQALAEGSAGTLRHLVAVYEQGSARIFIDGIEGEPRRSGRQPIDERAPLLLSPTPVLLDEAGAGRPTAVRYHDLALYGRALTRAEVRRLYRAGPDGLDRPRR